MTQDRPMGRTPQHDARKIGAAAMSAVSLWRDNMARRRHDPRCARSADLTAQACTCVIWRVTDQDRARVRGSATRRE